MGNEKITPIYFPSTVVVLDDDELFLNSIPNVLDNDVCELFSSPQKAIDFIKENQKNPVLGEGNYSLNEESMENVSVDINLEGLHQKIFDEGRFSTVSVVIADYSMPEMNGVDFFKEIGSSKVKKILLTGIADEATAIKAFNEGIIDKFIRKNSPNAAETINEFVKEMQYRCFYEQSNRILDALETANAYFCFDKNVKEVFFEKVKELDIVEFYLLSEEGDFLLLDGDGNGSVFVLKSKNDLKHYLDIAEDSEVPEPVITALREGKKIPFFKTRKAFSLADGEEWLKHVFDAHKITGEKTEYYFALIHKYNGFRKDSVVSYNKYVGL